MVYNTVDIKGLYNNSRRIIITAHRGFSGCYPENTLLAFKKAFAVGADIIEFDIRLTRDEVPIVSHDAKLLRFCGENIPINSLSFYEIKKFCLNHNKKIPSFREVLDYFSRIRKTHSSRGMNIQIKETDELLIKKACRFFSEYELYENAYFTVNDFNTAEKIRKYDNRIELCILERKQKYNYELLKTMKEYGCNFVQPHRRDITKELVEQIKSLGLLANLYYSNTDEDNRRFISYGIRGILTDFPNILLKTAQAMGFYTVIEK